MSRRLMTPMPAQIVDSQRRASDPALSVWVSANAGSGKTYVLTARVLRLLLSGVRPEEIICLTYTKAAAAEMRGRVSERLGRWTLMDDAALVADLTQLGGTPPTRQMLIRARALFAHALDTPGGLKIQTIHAFCESVLHRFPKEAGVPFDFTVLEDFERDAMLLQAREQILAAGLRGSGEVAAVETLFGLLSDFQIETAITEALGQQRKLKRVLARKDDAKRELGKLIGDVGAIEDVLEDIASFYPLTAADHAELFAISPPDPDGTGFIDRLAVIDPDHPDPDAMLEAFLTQERTARRNPLRKAIASLVPEIADKVVAECDRLERLARDLGRAELVARSEAMLDIVGAISAHYEAAKRARSLLDFDDLIEKLSDLLNDENRGVWVRYKLDSGISHILVDEGQDTNPRQWEVITALVAEFFYGDSAADRPRTLFVVGDQKQSIFSFQGADPTQFVDLGRQISFTARTVNFEIAPVKLHFSFRTLPHILSAVDRVFADPMLADGILEDGVAHSTARAEDGGTVTLWPPIKEVEEELDPDNWPTEAPKNQIQSAPRRVAERIAREIKSWLTSGRVLPARGRPITTDDILILVQVRSVLFHEIIRALIHQGIRTPGADRLAITTHIATLDMMALGDVLSNSSDDLQLAALLRTPLFDISEDDLRAVAQPRGEMSLWAAMRDSTIPAVKAAFTQLYDWRNRLDFERPFNFYSTVLYQEGGLRKFRARLGSEIDDVMAEFLQLALQHEQSPQPSLLGFIAELRSREVTIKRELAEGGSGVRVMTVHGAKGLEAPIVILADAATTEEGRDRRSIYMNETLPLFFHASSNAMHAAETMEHKRLADAAQKAEYWRKLYVAMTRAEDELYVTGYLTKAREGVGSWYEAIERGIVPASEVVADAEGVATALIYPRERAAETGMNPGFSAPPAPPPLLLPALPAYRLRRIVRPSSAADDIEPRDPLASAAEQARDPETARKEGIALHALLHHLLKIEPAQWPAVVAKAMPALLPDHPESHAPIAAKAQSILARSELKGLFGKGSRGEVPILAKGSKNGAPITIAGRIDRLVVEPGKVTIVDYKSDAAVPAGTGAVPEAYLTQLGLYASIAGLLFRDHLVEAKILWTAPESLMNLPSDLLRKSTASFTIG